MLSFDSYTPEFSDMFEKLNVCFLPLQILSYELALTGKTPEARMKNMEKSLETHFVVPSVSFEAKMVKNHMKLLGVCAVVMFYCNFFISGLCTVHIGYTFILNNLLTLTDSLLSVCIIIAQRDR